MCFELTPAQGSKQGPRLQLPDFVESWKLLMMIVEPSGVTTVSGQQFRFERLGYFVAERVDHVTGSMPVFNLAMRLKESWGE